VDYWLVEEVGAPWAADESPGHLQKVIVSSERPLEPGDVLVHQIDAPERSKFSEWRIARLEGKLKKLLR
jgi:hypothetical protein